MDVQLSRCVPETGLDGAGGTTDFVGCVHVTVNTLFPIKLLFATLHKIDGTTIVFVGLKASRMPGRC